MGGGRGHTWSTIHFLFIIQKNRKSTKQRWQREIHSVTYVPRLSTLHILIRQFSMTYTKIKFYDFYLNFFS